jgi:ferredoxin
MAYKISVDKDKCIGCGACTAVCDESFEMKGGKAVAKHSSVDEKDLTCEREAADVCPVGAISVKK